MSMGDEYMFAFSIQEENFIKNPSYNITFEYRDYILLPNGSRNYIKELINLEPCSLDHWKSIKLIIKF